MIISATPLRMSFIGGGSDLPVFYRRFGGAVVSTAIDKYVYITVNRKFDHEIRLSYSKTENVKNAAQLEHNLVKNGLQYMGVDGGLEITSIADIPASGSGLGSSSAFAAGLLHVLSAHQNKYISKADLAEQVCHLELDLCQEPIGKQDQYAVVYGGFNFIRFNQNDSVSVEPIICKPKTLRQIENSLLMFYTGISRSASGILARQCDVLASDRNKQQILVKMVGLAETLYQEICKNNVDSFGEILHENWMLKKSITNEVSSSQINDWYDKALKAGALGGKLLGAGGGGFLVFYVPLEYHESVKHVLSDLRCIDFKFEAKGSSIIFYHS